MIQSGNHSRVARFTEKNQYDSENASTCTPTHEASPQSGRPPSRSSRTLRTSAQTTTSTPTAMDTISPRNTAAHQGWSAYAPGTTAGMVLRNDCHGQVSSRTQPVDWAWYQAVQLPVIACR